MSENNSTEGGRFLLHTTKSCVQNLKQPREKFVMCVKMLGTVGTTILCQIPITHRTTITERCRPAIHYRYNLPEDFVVLP